MAPLHRSHLGYTTIPARASRPCCATSGGPGALLLLLALVSALLAGLLGALGRWSQEQVSGPLRSQVGKTEAFLRLVDDRGQGCSLAGENCSLSLCCVNSSLQCFRRDSTWATCKAGCTKGVDPSDPKRSDKPWDCEPLTLGIPKRLFDVPLETPLARPIQTPLDPASYKLRLSTDEAPSARQALLVDEGDLEKAEGAGPKPVAVSEAGKACVGLDEECTFGKCCRDSGATCFEKHPRWAICRISCIPGVNVSEPLEAQTPWSCKVMDADTKDDSEEVEADEFDCSAGLARWKDGWSSKKKKWCCQHKQKGCEDEVRTPHPSAAPTQAPTVAPTAAPTNAPTAAPTAEPTAAPTAAPTREPTVAPTAAPTMEPTAAPTVEPTEAPTASPTEAPTMEPTPSPTPPLPCASTKEPCTDSRCCGDPAAKCFVKDKGFAECRTECEAGIHYDEPEHLQTPWMCEELTKEGPSIEEVMEPGSSGDRFGKCSDTDMACTRSRCCKAPGQKCYMKDEGYAKCRSECVEGIQFDEPDFLRAPWSCIEIKAVSAEGTSTPSRPGQSLYCFALIVPDSYEVALMKTAFERHTGIFQCDKHQIISNKYWELNPGEPDPYPVLVADVDLHCEIGGKYHTALNSAIFVSVWKKVFMEGTYLKYDWTIKLDADAVFLASRLQERLVDAKPQEQIYLNNCKEGLHGPIEIISVAGMEVYNRGIDKCVVKLKFEWDTYGEDVFLRHCLGLLEVNRVDDFSLLTETFSGELPKCTSGAVAFHPLKKPERYLTCLAQTQL